MVVEPQEKVEKDLKQVLEQLSPHLKIMLSSHRGSIEIRTMGDNSVDIIPSPRYRVELTK